MANPKNSAYILLIIIILLSLVNLFQVVHAIDNNNNNNATTQNHKGFSLRLVHGNGPNLTEMGATRRREYIKWSKLRIKSLARIGKNNKTNVQDQIIRPPIRLDAFTYMVELELGTFDPSSSHKTVYLGFDTGSDLIWTQCEGCDECFRQVDPLYPATQSYTYSELTCSECPDAECVGNTCRVQVLYGDGAEVTATLARESLTFATASDTPLTIEGILFGCGINMEHFREDDEANNRMSGVFGMGYGKRSFQEQKNDVVKGKFQYCFQKKEAQELPPMYLRFGDDCIQPGTPRSIPMFRHENNDFYYLDVRGIQVNQKNLELPPDVFNIKPDRTGGFIIDSGTSVTFLATKAFRVLVDELAAQIESRNTNLERLSNAAARYEGFGLCYKRVREPTTFSLPWVTWVFANNAIFVTNPDVVFNIYTKHNGDVLVCLTIIDDSITILGSHHQVGHRITYDIPNGQLLVANEDCNIGR